MRRTQNPQVGAGTFRTVLAGARWLGMRVVSKSDPHAEAVGWRRNTEVHDFGFVILLIVGPEQPTRTCGIATGLERDPYERAAGSAVGNPARAVEQQVASRFSQARASSCRMQRPGPVSCPLPEQPAAHKGRSAKNTTGRVKAGSRRCDPRSGPLETAGGADVRRLRAQHKLARRSLAAPRAEAFG